MCVRRGVEVGIVGLGGEEEDRLVFEGCSGN